MNVAETVALVETAGVKFRLAEEGVRIWYPSEELRTEVAEDVAFLRAHRVEVAAFLRARGIVPTMPPGIRLISWTLKEPPVSIEAFAVVTDSARFATSTLEQLRLTMEDPKRWVGWSVPQLIDRLAQVGVVVALESKD